VFNIKHTSEEGLIVAVDFDGTILQSEYPNVGEPIPYAVQSLNKMIDVGIRIVIWTCRSDILPVIDFLDAHNIEVDAINSNNALTQKEWEKFNWKNSRKIGADVYIEDRGFINPIDVFGWTLIAKKLIHRYKKREGAFY